MDVKINSTLVNLYLESQKAEKSNDVVLADAGNALSKGAWKSYLGRDDDFKESSKRARTMLYNAVTSEFRGMGISMEKVPKEILKQLNLGDFNVENGVVKSCRPLTSYRVCQITKTIVEYKAELTQIAQEVVGKGIIEFSREAHDKFLDFTDKQKQMMIDCIVRDLARRDAEKLSRPSVDDLVASFKDGTHPALSVVITTARTGSEGSAHTIESRVSEAGMAGALLLPTVTGGGEGVLSAEKKAMLRDRQDLLGFAFPAGRKKVDLDACPTFAMMCEKLEDMRRAQPTGTIRFDTMWRAMFGEKMPKNLAKATDGTRAEQLFTRASKKMADDVKVAGGNCDSQLIMSEIAKFVKLGLKPSYALNVIAKKNIAGMPFSADQRLARFGVAVLQKTLERNDERFFRDAIKDELVRTNRSKFTFVGSEGKSEEMYFPRSSNGNHVDELLGKIGALVGENENQRRAVCLMLGQGGRDVLSAFHLGVGSEHNDAEFKLRKLDDGTVEINGKTPAYNKMDIQWRILVKPDGQNFQEILKVESRPESDDKWGQWADGVVEKASSQALKYFPDFLEKKNRDTFTVQTWFSNERVTKILEPLRIFLRNDLLAVAPNGKIGDAEADDLGSKGIERFMQLAEKSFQVSLDNMASDAYDVLKDGNDLVDAIKDRNVYRAFMDHLRRIDGDVLVNIACKKNDKVKVHEIEDLKKIMRDFLRGKLDSVKEDYKTEGSKITFRAQKRNEVEKAEFTHLASLYMEIDDAIKKSS